MARIIAAGLLAAVVLVVVADYLLPKKVRLARSISVAAPPSYLFEEIDDLEKWPRWAYWFSNDPDHRIIYGEKRVGIEAESTWESRRGKGKLTILSHRDDEMVRTIIEFSEKGTASWDFRIRPDSVDSSITVLAMEIEYTNGDDFPGGWKRLLFGTRLAPALDHNLRTLKQLAEMKPRFSPELTLESIAPTYYVSIIRSIPATERKNALTQIQRTHDSLTKLLRESNIAPAGDPFCRFTMPDDSQFRLECGIFVSPDAPVPAIYPIHQLYCGYVIRGIDHGAYDNVNETHAEVGRYIRYKEYEMDGDPWEVYIRDPANEKDTSRWVTEVYYPVRGVVGNW